MPAERRRGRCWTKPTATELAALGAPDRGPLRRAAGHRVGARADGRFCDRAVAADHRTARGRGRPVPTDWPCPIDHAAYFRASIVEQLPDPLSPLFADLIDGAVTRSLQRLDATSSWVGRRPRRRRRAADDQRLRLLPLQPLRHGRRAHAAQPAGLRGCVRQARLRRLGSAGETVLPPGYRRIVERWRPRDTRRTCQRRELLDGVAELVEAGADVLHRRADDHPDRRDQRECVLTGYYDSCVRRDGDPPASTFLLGYDSEPIRAEKSLCDLATLDARVSPSWRAGCWHQPPQTRWP